MALSDTEIAQLRQLIAVEAAILSLAGNEATITSKLAATKVNLSSLTAATAPADSDISLLRQGSQDKSVANSVMKAYVLNGGPYTPIASLPLYAPVVGTVRNLSASASTNATTVTYTADSIIVATSLGGQTYDLASFNQVLNLATTGIGGMDTGTLSANAWGAVYAAYNPSTGAKGIFCSFEGTTAAPTIYAGSALPSGYTATALIGFVKTGTTAGQLVAFTQKDRVFYWGGTSPLNGGVSSTSSVTAVGVSIPYAARKISGSVSVTLSAAGNGVFTFYGDTNGSGSKLASVSNGSGAGGNLFPYEGLLLSAAKTFLYYVTVSGTLTVTYQVYVTAFEF